MSASDAPRIPGLELVRPLGSGGYADVYLYEQQQPRMNVAVIVVDAALAVPTSDGSGDPATTEHAAAYRVAESRTPRAAVVATVADGVVFGPGDGSQEAVATAVATADEVRSALRGRMTRWVRLRSDADPRPLLARRERASGEKRTRRLRLPTLRRRGADPTPA